MRYLVLGAVIVAAAGGYWMGGNRGRGSRAFASPAVDGTRPYYVTQGTTSVTLWRVDNGQVQEATLYHLVSRTEPGPGGQTPQAVERYVEATVFRPRPVK